MHSDPVADFLTRIRNGCTARLQRINVPYSTLKERIAEVLKAEGYVGNFRVTGQAGTAERQIELELKFDEKRVPIIAGIKRMSSPGLRRHFDCDSIPKIRNGLGIIILTTSRGLMTDKAARKARVGGEALCSVW
jgi:small subunit ribosomal protein S8